MCKSYSLVFLLALFSLALPSGLLAQESTPEISPSLRRELIHNSRSIVTYSERLEEELEKQRQKLSTWEENYEQQRIVSSRLRRQLESTRASLQQAESSRRQLQSTVETLRNTIERSEKQLAEVSNSLEQERRAQMAALIKFAVGGFITGAVSGAVIYHVIR